MSLKVWLPLIGNADNKGCDNAVIEVNGATVNTNGKLGKCYSFDGSDDYISIDDTNLYNVIKGGDQPFSIAMWVYHADSTRAILFGDYALPGEIRFNIELIENHSVRFYWDNNPNHKPGVNVGASTWSHLAIVYDGSAVRMYLNGVLANTLNITLPVLTKTSGVFYVGRDNRTGPTAFNGMINDFRIYDHALSAAEAHELSLGLVRHYKFDGANDVCDSSGYNNHGTIVGTLSVETPSPRYSACFYMDARNTTNHIEALGLPNTTQTVSIWVKSNNNSSSPVIFTDNTSEMMLVLSSSGHAAVQSGSSNKPCYSLANYSKTEWNHFVVTKNGSQYGLWVNGVQAAQQDTNSYRHDGDLLYFFNRNYNDDYAAKAYISDFRAYATLLSEADIKALYYTNTKIDHSSKIHSYSFEESGSRELMTGTLWTSEYGKHTNTPYTNKVNNEYVLTGHVSIGSVFVPITPTGHTYMYDIEISVDAGNVFYIGFQRYDKDLTPRNNNATIYLTGLHGETDARSHAHYRGTVDLSTDGYNPCAFISLRILNDWDEPDDRSATIHRLSLREVSTIQTPSINNNGVLETDELNENTKAAFYKNGFVEAKQFIEF